MQSLFFFLVSKGSLYKKTPPPHIFLPVSTLPILLSATLTYYPQSPFPLISNHEVLHPRCSGLDGRLWRHGR